MQQKLINLAISIILKMVVVLLVLLTVRCFIIGEFYIRGLRPLLVSGLLVVLTELFFESKKKYYLSVFAFVSTISSVLYIKKFAQEVLNFGMYNEIVSFSIGCVNAVLVLFLILGNSILATVSKICIVVMLLLPIVFLWGYYLSSGTWVTVDTVMAVLQTNFSESAEYLSDFLQVTDWLSLITLFAGMLALGVFVSKLKPRNLFRYGSVVLVGGILLNGYFAYRHKSNIVTDIAIQTKVYAEKYKDFEKKKVERKNALKNIISEVKNENTGVFVLVIGESQNRNNMSAYGYGRETTPWLSSMKNEENFILFENVYSCHTHTVPVLTYALTAKNQYNNMKLGESVSLLEVVEAAGEE